jgi:hypothetical protein
MAASPTAANASLSSNRSMSETLPSIGSSARLIARDGYHPEAHDLGDRGHAELVGLLAAHQHQRGRAVGDLRRVAGGDGAVALERGAQPGEGVGRGLGAHALVGGHHDRVALALGDLHRRDLVGEATRGHGLGGAGVALGRELVLGLTGDAAERPAVALGARAHVHGVERAPQAVLDQRVEHLAVPHAVPGPGLGQEVRRVGHRLHPAGVVIGMPALSAA